MENIWHSTNVKKLQSRLWKAGQQ